jgi:MYXO-CTERM domain-containing protein
MSTQRTRITVSIAAFLAVAGLSGPAAADQISSAIYLDVDTSGSMVQATNGTQCRGDGSDEHPHAAGCESRIFIAKNAISTVVNGYPEVRWGLARFTQNLGVNIACHYRAGSGDPNSNVWPCSDFNRGSPWEFDAAGNQVCVSNGNISYYNYCHDLVGNDRMCINYWGTCGGADILVALADDNEALILPWINHQEPAGGYFTGTEPVTGNHCWSGAAYGDCELRGHSGTPLAASLDDLYTQLSTNDIGSDPFRGCRPYSIIMLTDGDESCGGNPPNSAAALRTTPDTSSTCNNDGDCPPNSWCTGNECNYDVKTYVIAFAQASLGNSNAIAFAGGTAAAIPAWNEDDIVAAMAGIIAESIVQELCNGVDDDCDTEIDEDYPIGQACNNGLPGVCYGVGTFICDPTDPTNVICDISPAPPVPGANDEVCNGLDDDCDGEIDEGGVCTCNGPELCNGFDDYCDGYVTEVEGAEDPNIGAVCGTNVGACVAGLTECVGGAIQCSGTGAVAEDCDANITANDQNCNGVNNDGIAPRACVKTNVNGTCDGMETCDVDGVWVCWAQEPAPESCNSFDDDCDTFVDEGLGQTTCGLGICMNTVDNCVGGVPQTCNPLLNQGTETCNDLDDNCDGAVDEGLSKSCHITNTEGTCTGTETCSAGVWVGCTAQTPVVEICNNLDDDCDTVVDEGLTDSCYSGPASTLGVGPCAGGTRTCSAGSWGSCSGETTPVTETCDGVDNDCDGTVDNLGQTTCGLGICRNTVDNCSSGAPQTCNPLLNQGTETCNDLDDDCDGIVDGLTAACYRPATGCVLAGTVWTCQGTCSTGTYTCPAGGGGWNTCQFDVGPGTEVCDGQDNDCDGSTDENLTEVCYPLGYGVSTGCTALGACVGVCSEGSRTCSGGAWGSCGGATTPVVETCNGADDDCDGAVDEGLDQGCQNTNTEGTCTGVEICSSGSWQTCTAAIPAAETCNNIDDDCDGAVDEGVTDVCYTGAVGTEGQGVCHGGTLTCTAGTWSATCSGEVIPTAEVCDGLDNDCDGLVDEGPGGSPLTQACYSGPTATEDVGVCIGGTRTCTSGAWSSCVGEVVPSSEQCNGLDDDCDNDTDENLGQSTCGLGVCLHTVDNCVSGAAQVCDPYQGAVPEECDGVDNDCDGVVDGLARNCYDFGAGCIETAPDVYTCEGTCSSGLEVCPVGGTGDWGECLYDVGPGTEVCDGLDNDCDGAIDEGANGSPLSQQCYPPGSGTSTGCTYDTNTQTWSCLGLCTVGDRECIGAAWGTCTGHITPAVEVCDGSDNDCDGDIDEEEDIPGLNQPCGTALGRCTPGVLRCIDSSEICEGGDGPFPPACNGEDDDCDGEIDEPDEVSAEEGLPCGESEGACEPGLTQCVGGGLICDGGVLPTEEVCDGLDNDCDGVPDDAAECPPNFWCVQADCRPHCDPSSEFPCPGTMACVEVDVGSGQMEYVCLPDTGGDCGEVTCPDGWICENEVCVDPCDPNPCQSWEDCHEGACIDRSCTGLGQSCDTGEFCVDHECVPDPCLSATCDGETEVCVRDCDDQSCDYSCSPLCTCPGGQTCEGDGTCVEDPCFGADCGLGERCDPDTGTCETDPCAAIFCSSWETCFEGACIDDPCGSVDCPPFYNCEVFTVASGDGTEVPEPRCVADTSYYAPGSEGDQFLATGSGGCQCQTTGTGDLPGGLLLLLLVLGVLRLSRRSGRGGVR